VTLFAGRAFLFNNLINEVFDGIPGAKKTHFIEIIHTSLLDTCEKAETERKNRKKKLGKQANRQQSADDFNLFLWPRFVIIQNERRRKKTDKTHKLLFKLKPLSDCFLFLVLQFNTNHNNEDNLLNCCKCALLYFISAKKEQKRRETMFLLFHFVWNLKLLSSECNSFRQNKSKQNSFRKKNGKLNAHFLNKFLNHNFECISQNNDVFWIENKMKKRKKTEQNFKHIFWVISNLSDATFLVWPTLSLSLSLYFFRRLNIYLIATGQI